VESFLAFDALAATAGHIDMIQSKLEKLHDAREEAWAQLLTAAGRMYRAGEIDATQLQQFHRDMRDSYGSGFSKLWTQHAPIPGNKLMHVAERERRIAQQSGVKVWNGGFPLGFEQLIPDQGIAVVYMLLDHFNVPAYVGSTESFRQRMKPHLAKWPGVFANWTAWRCPDREAAYVLEDRLLREHLPYLNKKASR
jgi:hypothetical protein